MRGALIVRESAPPAAPKPRLLDQVRGALRAHHYTGFTSVEAVDAPGPRIPSTSAADDQPLPNHGMQPTAFGRG